MRGKDIGPAADALGGFGTVARKDLTPALGGTFRMQSDH